MELTGKGNLNRSKVKDLKLKSPAGSRTELKFHLKKNPVIKIFFILNHASWFEITSICLKEITCLSSAN